MESFNVKEILSNKTSDAFDYAKDSFQAGSSLVYSMIEGDPTTYDGLNSSSQNMKIVSVVLIKLYIL